MEAQDPITGEWDAVLSYPDQRELMTMMLMLDGDKVSGRVESGQGVFMLEKGEFASDHLKMYMPSAQGEIELSAQLADGKLVGEYNVADKAQGEWEAVKR
jgi:hypothetical protein